MGEKITTLWIIIVIIGVATYITRAAPLFWRSRGHAHRQPPAWLFLLGPCLLAAMAVTIIAPFLSTSIENSTLLPVGFGFAAVAASMLVRKDPGIATLAGVLAYFVTL
ncbi:MAG: AzlD domain-containing protein [Parvularculales bacterium]